MMIDKSLQRWRWGDVQCQAAVRRRGRWTGWLEADDGPLRRYWHEDQRRCDADDWLDETR